MYNAAKMTFRGSKISKITNAKLTRHSRHDFVTGRSIHFKLVLHPLKNITSQNRSNTRRNMCPILSQQSNCKNAHELKHVLLLVQTKMIFPNKLPSS